MFIKSQGWTTHVQKKPFLIVSKARPKSWTRQLYLQEFKNKEIKPQHTGHFKESKRKENRFTWASSSWDRPDSPQCWRRP